MHNRIIDSPRLYAATLARADDKGRRPQLDASGIFLWLKLTLRWLRTQVHHVTQFSSLPSGNKTEYPSPALETLPADATARIESQARADLIRSAMRTLPGNAFGGFVGIVLFSGAFWRVLPGGFLAVWAAVLTMDLLCVIWIYRAFNRTGPGNEAVQRWGSRTTLLALGGGLAWGSFSLPLSMIPEFDIQALLILGLALVGAIGGLSSASYLQHFYAFCTPIFIALAATLAIEGDKPHLLLAIGATAMLAFLAFVAHKLHGAFLSAMRLSARDVEMAKLLKVRTEEAENANVDKTRFLAAASHDLRQPMHAMGLLVGALRERIQYPEVRALVDKIQASVDAMDSLLTSMLDMSKLDAGMLVPNVAGFPIRQLLERMELQYGTHARNKGLSFKIVSSRAIVNSDPALLDRIVRNLVSNAVRHTSSGRVTLGCRRTGEHLNIEVWDTGPGIAQQQLEHIFHEFYQLGNPERDRRKGLGLGLSIVKRLAGLLDHQIDVYSTVDKGSCFSVRVPMAKHGAAEKTGAAGAEPAGQLYGAFIVVIDDDEDILAGMSALLQQWGCHTVAANSGADAVSQLQKHERVPDLILSDYRLRGGETGTEAIVRIRAAQEATIPAVLITGDTAPDRLKQAASSGFPIIHKPVSPDQLRLVLSTILAPANQGGKS
jgi:two-component system, sensor histidine kinase